MNPDLALAHELADIADAISLPEFQRGNHVVRTKPDRTPVTQTDVAVETALRAHLALRRPNDAVLGEEQGYQPGTGSGTRRWIIDPIDGTKNFMSGIPLYGTLIALEIDGRIAVAVVSMPALNAKTRYWAERDGGAWKREGTAAPRQIHVNRVDCVENGVLAWSGVGGMRPDAERRFHALRSRFFLNRKVGNTWAHMLVAEGAAAAGSGGHISVWDVAAPRLIIEEAGGRMTNWAGDPTLAAGTALWSNGLVHAEIVKALQPSWLQRAHDAVIWWRATLARSGPHTGGAPSGRDLA